MHRDFHNFTLRRGISEVNSPTIRSDDRRTRVLQGRPQALELVSARIGGDSGGRVPAAAAK
jgi:hypothetical protein